MELIDTSLAYGNMNMSRQETLNQGVRADIAIANVFAASQQQQ